MVKLPAGLDGIAISTKTGTGLAELREQIMARNRR